MMLSLVNKITFSFMVFVLLCSVHARNVENNPKDRTSDISANSCVKVKPFFETRNISVHHHHQNGATCGGPCCGEREETALRLHVQKDFATMLGHNSRSLQGLLATTATTLHDHMTELASQSENKTLHLFAQVYQRMAVLSREPISALYADIKRHMLVSEGDATFSPSNLDIKASVSRFFTDLFPLVYHHAINPHAGDFSTDYKHCLREAINELQPFGDIPRQISMAAFKSLEATRVLLQAFTVGVEILNATDTLLTAEHGSHNNACHQALLKMTYCPKCRGLASHTKPCTGYCLNVLRGCLTQHVTELDSPWNDYVEAIEKLVIAVKQHDAGVNADDVIRSLDTKISEAIMYAMENGPSLEQKVKLTCGHAKLSEKEDPLMSEPGFERTSGSNTPQRMSSSLRTTPPDTQLLHFLASVVKSRGFYGTLADSLCKDDSFAETRDDRTCWNGHSIGEYTETVVDTSLSVQKYNPEVQLDATVPSGGPLVARLADKLRHVRQVVMSALGSAGVPESDSYMQGDAAEGSGSGYRVSSYSDDSDDAHGEGSGSGDHETGEPDGRTKFGGNGENPKPPTHKQAHPEVVETGSSSMPTASAVLCTILSLLSVTFGRQVG